MSDSVLVILSCGTDNPNRTTRGLFLAAMAHKQGKKAALFLLDEGVYIARQGLADQLKSATGDTADDHLSYMQEFEIPILVCTPCAKARRIDAEDLVQGARMATGDELIKLACDSAVISL